jgi:uncharacterized protein YdaU (DUF1376 family)
LNFYAFHIGDYVVHTRHLSLMEDLAYRRLLDLYYTRERALPADPTSVARLIGMAEHAEAVATVLKEFFTAGEGEWKHARCDAEIARMQDKQAKAKASAQASVNARSANAQRTPKKRSATKTKTKTTPITKEPPQPPMGEGDGFDKFWAAWPSHTRKAAEQQCRDKWAIRGCEEIADRIVQHVEALKASEGWRKDRGQFIPAPLVYLNQSRWESATEMGEQTEWHETRAGVEKKAASLGLPKWDELCQFAEYKSRILAAAGANA